MKMKGYHMIIIERREKKQDQFLVFFFLITQKFDMKKFSFSVQVAICWHRAWPSKPNNAH